MIRHVGCRCNLSRRDFSIAVGFLALNSLMPRLAEATGQQTLDERFDFLSNHGNSTCSPAFTDSITKMSTVGRLQGSCCSPMDRHRYGEQVEALKKYASVPEIPQDPYDIAAGTAQKAMSYFDLALSPDEQKAYQYAMDNSDEKGPCCCQCWRWRVYGGLGKFLIREHQFTGEKLVEVWNLSSGCGGGEEHQHG
ncbi:hypothetical protein [Mesorhizobium delmotii]|uniref:Uncharacterized protein n=1 Tax=Mesorhizobium delmotii TaxID=1631247 RepID=A0A2P9AR78_9HYPH|nr:hypothetical protein [Mesorhizobium delmotii]SJM33671.1 conserved hypothetical protein [Mesorhizobium delmotii]